MLTIQKDSQKWALISLAVSMLLTSVAVSIPNVALPAIAHDFGASVAEAQRVIVGYLSAVTLSLVFTGRLGDILGRRKVLLLGLFVYLVAALISVFAPTL